jgi:nitroreductase
MSDPMEVIKPLLRTRQFREFTDEPVTESDIQALINVARWSGSAGNSQPWRFIVVRDVELLRRLSELGHPQTRGLATAMAALVITLPDEPNRAMVDAYDEGRAAERILIAATMLDLGAGIQWVTQENRQPIAEALGLDHGRFVRTIMALGHPSERARELKTEPGKARVALDQLVSYR